LNQQFRQKKLSPIKITLASSTLEAEDILEMVNAGFINLTVVDHHIADIWSQALKDMVVRKDLKVNTGGQLAWAVRKNNPKLLTHLNEFVKDNKKGTLIGNILFKRYYADTKWIKNPISPEERKKLDRYIGFFKKYSDMYDFDWLAIAAQAYQESKLDQNLKSPAGAIGLMQLLPSTAEYVGIKNIQDAENNIHAGVKYMHYLREKFFNDPGIEPGPKFDFTLAAYNAGPNRVNQLREQAEKMGLDKNRWFFNVERAALDKVGQEPVRYVGNINKYYIAFSLIMEQREKKEKERKTLAKD
jgi:membrane-bound lytic murein transglycosylase MltF